MYEDAYVRVVSAFPFSLRSSSLCGSDFFHSLSLIFFQTVKLPLRNLSKIREKRDQLTDSGPSAALHCYEIFFGRPQACRISSALAAKSDERERSLCGMRLAFTFSYAKKLATTLYRSLKLNPSFSAQKFSIKTSGLRVGFTGRCLL